MPNSAGVEVARISVKVSPDTREFRRDLKKQLDKEEKAANGAGPEVSVGAETKKLKADVARATSGLKAQVDVEAKPGTLDRFQRRTAGELQSGMNKLEVKINLDNAGEQFRRDIEKASSELEKLIKSPIPKDIGAASTRRTKISEEINALMELGKDNPKASANWLGVSDRQFQLIQRLTNIRRIAAEQDAKAEKARHTAQLASWKDELNHMKMREDETRKFLTQHAKDNPPLDLKLDPKFDYKLRKNLAKMKPKIDIEPDVKRRSAAGILSGLGDIPGKLSSLMPSFGGGINPMGYIVILGAAIALAAPLIGLLSTAILSIPGLIAAVATPFAAIALGMDGIKKAAETSGLMVTGADGKSTIGPFLDDIKKQVSDAFEVGLTPSFTALKDALPSLLASMPKVATGLSDLVKGFTDAVTSGPGVALFNETVANIGAAMSQAAPGVQSFTNGLLRITTAFSQELPGLSTWFNKTGDSFQKWVEQMTTVDPTTGTTPMSESFQGLGDTLKTIGNWIVDLAKQGMEFVKDPAKMQEFIGTLKNVGDAIAALVALGNQLGPAWRFLNGGTDNAPWVDTVKAPQSPGVGSGGPAGTTESVKDGLATVAEGQAQGQVEVKGFWGSALDFLQTIAGANNQIGQGGVQMVGPSGKSYPDVKSMTDDLVNESNRLNGEIANLTATVSNQLEFHGGRETDRIREWKADLAELQAESDKVKAAAAAAQVSLTTAPPAPPSGAGTFVDQIIGDLTKVGPQVATTLQQAKDQVASSGVLTPDALGQVSAAAQQPKVEVPQVDLKAFETSMGQMPAVVGAKGDEAATRAAEIPPKIIAAIGDMNGTGQKIGNDLAAGFAIGIAAGMPGVEAAARDLAIKAKDAAKAALDSHSPSKVFIGIGEDTSKGFQIGMENGFQPVLDQARDMAGKVADAFAGGNIDPSGIIDGLSKDDIKNMEKVLGIEQKRLEIQAKALQYKGDKEGAKALRAKKDELGLQKDMLDLTSDLNDETSKGEDPLVKAAAGLMKSPVDFAKATGQQFMSDIGISGNGLISKAVTEGISYIFQIGSVDEALAIKDRQEKTQAMTIVGAR